MEATGTVVVVEVPGVIIDTNIFVEVPGVIILTQIFLWYTRRYCYAGAKYNIILRNLFYRPE